MLCADVANGGKEGDKHLERVRTCLILRSRMNQTGRLWCGRYDLARWAAKVWWITCEQVLQRVVSK